MKKNDAADKLRALQASEVFSFAARHTVVLSFYTSTASANPDSWGTGILFKVGETRWIMTAKHVLDDWNASTMVTVLAGKMDSDGKWQAPALQLAVGYLGRLKLIFHPKADVALIQVEPASHETKEFLDHVSLSPREMLPIEPDNIFPVTFMGYPGSLASRNFDAHVGMTALFYDTAACPKSKRQLCGPLQDECVLLDVDYLNVHSYDNSRQPLPDLRGGSGGGYWMLIENDDMSRDVVLIGIHIKTVCVSGRPSVLIGESPTRITELIESQLAAFW